MKKGSVKMIIAITNRRLCEGDFLACIERVAQKKPYALILREKDLQEKDYEALALQCKKICKKYGVTLVLHSFWETAKRMDVNCIHFSADRFRAYRTRNKKELYFEKIGVSIHSKEEAVEMEKMGASYLLAGHIFSTNCKEGLAPRGLQFLQEICACVSIPVFGVGGMEPQKQKEVMAAGAAGIAIMSGYMQERG